MSIDSDKYTEQKPVLMTKKEAEGFFMMLNATRFDNAEQIKKVQRSRSMTNSVKVSITNEANANIKKAQELQEKIGTAFNIGGY